jgi:crossover junction endodeoxyribonuclease RuvC
MRIVGIDPGVSGAAALLIGGKLEAVAAMPTVTAGKKGRRIVDAGALSKIIRDMAPEHAIVEQVGVRPGEGVVGAFSFGRSAGILEGVLGALAVPRTMVTPAQWKVELRVPADKNEARARASRLMNRGDLWPMKKDDGKAEAALLAYWGYLKLGRLIEW